MENFSSNEEFIYFKFHEVLLLMDDIIERNLCLDIFAMDIIGDISINNIHEREEYILFV